MTSGKHKVKSRSETTSPVPLSFLESKMTDEDGSKRLDKLLRHIKNVQENCILLGESLIHDGKQDLGIELIANAMIHDNSKFSGIEWLYLNCETKETSPELFKAALMQHNTTNLHHPEAHVGGIQAMPPVYLAEMCADWKARSEEFGSDIWNWVKGPAAEKYGYTTSSRVYKDIKGFLEIILEPAFS